MEKLKQFLSDDAFFYSILLVLVGVTAFGLGRHSVEHGSVSEVATVQYGEAEPLERMVPDGAALAASVVEAEASAASPQTPEATTDTSVVASKNGTKYHLPTCTGAKQIKPENLITFVSVELARAAGYEPAKNCQF